VYTGLFENSDSNALMPRFKHSSRVELPEAKIDIRDVSSQQETMRSPKDSMRSSIKMSDIYASIFPIH